MVKLSTIAIILVAIIIIGVVGYWGYSTANARLSSEKNNAYNQGYSNGAIDVITYISLQSGQCNVIPLNVSGKITNIISVDCLKGGK